jgi:hypothetical protein
VTVGRGPVVGAVVCILGWLGTGCHANVNGHPASVTRDSAGITIVESFALAWGTGDGWHLLDKPTLRIGAVEGDPPYLLLDVRSALRVADGTIVVANAGTEELRFFDASGRFLRTAGGQGGGPGEFMNLVWVYPYGGDSLVAWDDDPPRIAIFDERGLRAVAASPIDRRRVARRVRRRLAAPRRAHGLVGRSARGAEPASRARLPARSARPGRGPCRCSRVSSFTSR